MNGDGYVNARDVELLLRYLTGWTRENYPALAAFRADLADLNDDGVLTARDSWLLAEKVVGRAVHNAEATVGEYGNDGAPRGADVITEIKGDTNGDGKVNAKDVVALMKAVVFGDPSLLMDLNGDGRINAKDVVTLMKLIVTTLATEPTLHTDVDIDDFPQSYNDFISGAVFCGDSICWLMSHYGVLPEENVVAAIGAGVFSIRMQEIFPFTVDGVECSFDEAIITRDPKRIVLWIGINDCGYTLDRFLYGYGELLEALKEDAPNAQIYVMSIAPIGDAASVVEKYGVTNETVDGMNRAIAGVCEEHGATFVDVSTALKDDNNKLSDEFFASDGLHLPVNAYEVVLKTFLHTVLGD